jgi:hypothetical protein
MLFLGKHPEIVREIVRLPESSLWVDDICQRDAVADAVMPGVRVSQESCCILAMLHGLTNELTQMGE